MKDLVKNLTGRSLYLLLIAIGLFSLAFVIDKYIIGTTSARYYASLIESDIKGKELNFQNLTGDTALLNALIDKTYNEELLEEVLDKEKGYSFFIYRKDTANHDDLIFWNTQTAIPPINILGESDASRAVRLSNGLYIQISKSIYISGNQYSVEGLIPVMWEYFVEIENLKKEFVSFPDAGKRVSLTRTVTEYPVKSTFGNTLFYLEKTNILRQQTSWPALLLVLMGIFFFLLYVHHAAHTIASYFGLWQGVLFLILVIVLIRGASYYFPGILNLRQFELFDPAIYSSSFVLSSLGDLFINAALFCWVVLFINRRIPEKPVQPFKHTWLNWIAATTMILFLVSFTFIFADILQSLVSDAQISFNVTNFFSLIKTPYSFISFVILATLALSYFFISQLLLTISGTLTGERTFIILVIAAFIGLLLLTFIRNTAVIELNLYVLLWLLVYIWMMKRKVFSGLNFRLNISEVLFWLFVFSFSIAAVIIFENRKIEFEQRVRFAEKLSYQADPSSQTLLSMALTYLDNEYLSKTFPRFKEASTNKALKDSIINKNFSVFLNRYDTRLYTYGADMAPQYNEDSVSFETLNTIYDIQGKETSIVDLRYFEKTFDKFSYISRKVITDSSGINMGYLFILSEPRNYKMEALVPKLFKQSRELLPEYAPNYSYAIYSNFELMAYYNDYPFPTHLNNEQLPKGEYNIKKDKEYEELWYRHSGDKVVVIVKKDNSFIEAITLFAYLFSTFLFLLATYRFATMLIRSKLKKSVLRQNFQLSIRSQIHSTIIMVSLLSFVVIGVATILFFINRYDRNNQDRLSRAIQIMVNEVEILMKEHNVFNDGFMLLDQVPNEDLEKLMQEISEIHGLDVNLYDTLGTLRFSSNPFIYNKGVLSEKMNPEAYFRVHHLRAIQCVTDEKMGKVSYLSIYCPVRDTEGNPHAFLNIPSYSTQEELKQEISNFLVTIINLNAFIFLVAGAIALFITNRITSSFTIIGEKMRDINLRKMNQEIHWKRNDEIGELVKEYNKMVHKLDESADALAKSEREGAWRQMARQVAHEIKNPLTPMKLSIQYLQKAIDNNSVNVKEMTTNVARTLVEQIDHLSKIASDFSQFANIGNPRNEVFDLHDLLYSLTSLYETTEHLQFDWDPVSQRVMLFADKTQLNRLFTNLFQNAIEAPDEISPRLIHIGEELNGEYIMVSVKDNGGGIPDHMQDKIFTPNFTTKSSGTGLGLAMSKSIAEQAHGDIWFESVMGEGTTFFVKLPLLRATN
ncbi:MAG: GHKL domain-containing protein [Chitinophagaceae bacterium]|nr:GHKL domain-containing protein [Chitinophagaceae bacterium]